MNNRPALIPPSVTTFRTGIHRVVRAVPGFPDPGSRDSSTAPPGSRGPRVEPDISSSSPAEAVRPPRRSRSARGRRRRAAQTSRTDISLGWLEEQIRALRQPDDRALFGLHVEPPADASYANKAETAAAPRQKKLVAKLVEENPELARESGVKLDRVNAQAPPDGTITESCGRVPVGRRLSPGSRPFVRVVSVGAAAWYSAFDGDLNPPRPEGRPAHRCRSPRRRARRARHARSRGIPGTPEQETRRLQREAVGGGARSAKELPWRRPNNVETT